MATAQKYADLKVGDKMPDLKLPPISRHQLALYCGGSGDHNPIHVDIDFAKKFGFKDVFAHGMLSMAFLGRHLTNWVPQSQVRKLGTRFTSITWVGDVITVSGKVTGKREEEARSWSTSKCVAPTRTARTRCRATRRWR